MQTANMNFHSCQKPLFLRFLIPAAYRSTKANQLLGNTQNSCRRFLHFFRKPQANKPFELMIIECMRAFTFHDVLVGQQHKAKPVIY